MSATQYFDRVTSILEQIQKDCLPQIEQAARMIVDTVSQSHFVYFFGCTHAGILTQEVFYRTGGLAVMNPIFAPGLLVSDTPVFLTSELERVKEYGAIIAEQSNLQKGDLLFIHSVSGRNSVPVELAQQARKTGVQTIAITGMEYSRNTTSRHPDGKKLYELCDLVIDNKCPLGDALIPLGENGPAAGPGSTVAGAAIVNAIAVEAAELFAAQNGIAPVLKSANLDDGEAYNKAVYEKYRNSIRYLVP